jgi:hypothetical protein
MFMLQFDSRTTSPNNESPRKKFECFGLPICWWSDHWCSMGHFKRHGVLSIRLLTMTIFICSIKCLMIRHLCCTSKNLICVGVLIYIRIWGDLHLSWIYAQNDRSYISETMQECINLVFISPLNSSKCLAWLRSRFYFLFRCKLGLSIGY